MKLVLFDCDGTLVDSAGLIHEVMARTFEDFGLARVSLDATKGIIGLTLDIAIARLMHQPHVDDRALAMTAHYKKIYGGVRAEMDFREPLFPGIASSLPRFRHATTLILGAVTGKSRRGLDQICCKSRLRKDILRFENSRRLPVETASGDGDGMLLGSRHRPEGHDRHRRCDLRHADGEERRRRRDRCCLGLCHRFPNSSRPGADHIAQAPNDILDWMETYHA